MVVFGPKPWVNPLEKMSIFRLFKLLVFIAQKGIFSFQKIVKDIFLAIIALKKKFEKWPFLDQNHGLTLLEKCQFFDLLNFFFFIAQKDVFSFQNIVKDIFLAFIASKKKLEKWPIFEPKPQVNPFWKNVNFSIFLIFLFLQLTKAFFCSRIPQKTFPWPIFL